MTHEEMPTGLRRAYLLVLAPPAALAPIPLVWTNGVSLLGIFLYEIGLAVLWYRALRRAPVRLSAAVMNAAGLLYFFWLGFEVVVLRHGLLRSVTHLLLFSALAKLASLKHPGEARTGLLVLFLVMLAAASSSFHVSSLLYFAAMAIVTFWTLGRLAVLADFDEAPPDHVIRSVPTGGLAAVAILGAGLLAAPLFYALPRLRGPYALAPFRLDDAFSTTLAADRVDLEAFGAAKRSDRVVLRLNVEPAQARRHFVRLREAVFTDYRAGGWTRQTRLETRPAYPPRLPRNEGVLGRGSVELKLHGSGFLFLPYAPGNLDVQRGVPLYDFSDGVLQARQGGSIRYTVAVRRGEARGVGKHQIPPESVPREVRQYAQTLTGNLRDPRAIAERIASHFERDFVYTLDAPAPVGDAVAHFLLRSKAGHCEYFASAAALMLASRGVPARLVTGSYGGEIGLFSGATIVRGGNLHAWVEADLDGSGFAVFDPTPPAGIPASSSRVSFLRRLASLGREIEFFYDRSILGFDPADQGQVFESARESLGGVASWLAGWRKAGGGLAPWARTAAMAVAGLALVVMARRLWRERQKIPAATRAYLALRRQLARLVPGLSPATAPAEVARLFARAVPEGEEDAHAIVQTYCASAFGGIPPELDEERRLATSVQRLRRLASKR